MMRRKCFTLLLLLLTACAAQAQESARHYRILDGYWKFDIDRVSNRAKGFVFPDSIYLPGTTDTNKKGNPPARTDETTHLTRLHSFVGKALYKRNLFIPMTWRGKRILLHMERTKPTTVFVDGKTVGSNDNISTRQVYDLTHFMKPGMHELCILVDNSEEAVPKQIVSNSHAYTEDTQTNWNGILGDFYLEATSNTFIDDISIQTDAANHAFTCTAEIHGKLRKGLELRFILIPWGSNYGIVISRHDLEKSKKEVNRFRVKYQSDDLLTWSEFHPNLYRLRVEIVGPNETVTHINDETGIYDNTPLVVDIRETTFGLCDFKTQGTQFTVNGQTTFLRGKHDACVFPLMAHVPTSVEEWRHYFQVCKGYGINHVRFHSWCPPDACFTAADIEGIYLQPELPFWGDFNRSDDRLMSFLLREGQDIIREYGHHPSFVMMALGNELWGDIPTMRMFVDQFRQMAPQKLFTFGSNYYLGYQGWKEGMDYFTTCRVGGEEWGKFNTHTRGSFSFADTYDGGMLNHFYPNSSMNFSEGIKACPVPVISHETAQFQTYPDYDEIRKYRGVLYPYNMEVFRSRLEKAGMLDQAKDFHKASGLWSMQLYKADIEMDLRTPGFGGFQLLDLQDYPGQGSAYVGVLDAFMESKGLITPEEFRGFCSPIVPLFVADKFCFTNDERLSGRIQLANYAEPTGPYQWRDGILRWELTTADGNVFARDSIAIPQQSHGLVDLGQLSVSTAALAKAQKLMLRLHTYYNKESGQCFTNTYPLWVFPADVNPQDMLRPAAATASPKTKKQAVSSRKNVPPAAKDIIVSHRYDVETARQLSGGATVLLMPDTTELRNLTVGGLFQTDYWNYRMFKTISENNKKPVSPGTLGILCNPKHPLFRDFPTDMHTSWQWFPMIKASRPFMLDNTAPQYRPIVQVIDNIERNHKLGLIFEFAVDKGKLLVCMSPLDKLTQYPEARQLYSSVLQYMMSADFNPQTRITYGDLQQLFTTPVVEGKIGELNNISPY